MIVDHPPPKLVIWLCVALGTLSTATPVQVPPGSRDYGLDGPWTSLRILVSRNYEREAFDPSKLDAFDVFPGGWRATMLPTTSMCDGDPDCGTGGRFNPNTSVPDELRTASHVLSFDRPSGSGSMEMTGSIAPHSIAIPARSTEAMAKNTIPHVGIVALTIGNYVIGESGSRRRMQIGYLALGGTGTWPFDARNIDGSGPTGVVEYWPPGSWLANQSVTTSNSFGLHVGSAAFNYSASMFYGGYNRGRTIGPIVEYNQKAAYLQDIIIGVETGGSPFAFNETQKGLLVNSESVQTSIPVSFQPMESYLALPRQTCDKIAALLPVTYDSALNLYLWDVGDERYETIVSSPAYLGFVFPPSGSSSQRVTIKVPFALLNLMLDPLYSGRQSEIPYFPCQPWLPQNALTAGDTWPIEGTYILGKSFLQAAFFGRNWDNDRGWVVQAPGPGALRNGLGDDIRDINRGDTEIDTNSDLGLFATSWSDHWTPLPGFTTDDSDAENNGSSLSLGTKAGIGVAVGLAALVAIIGAILFIRRRKSASRSNKDEQYRDVQEIQVLHSEGKGTEYYPQAAVPRPAWMSDPQETASRDGR